MQRLIQYLSLGFIGGIVVAMSLPLSHQYFPYFLGLIMLCFGGCLILMRKGKPYALLFIVGAVLAGWTDFSWKIDTSSPHHIVHFADDHPWRDKTEVGGWIVKEPEVRQYKTNVTLRPEYVRVDEKGPKMPVEGGLVLLQLRPSMKRTYGSYNFGDYVVTHYSALVRPQPANNPGIFDYRRFLRNNNIYGMMNLRKDYQLKAVPERKYRNAVVDFALNLKKELLWTIKKTMPYPESAFLGGVMLGLRQGLSKKVQDEFRAAGVAHVLAVSGLHVTIITALLFGILSMFRVPRKFMAPPIIAGLIIFAIITGARPSTLRAVIMNSISLISFCYLASNLRTSLLFGISTAASLILFFNPMILFEASFLYSFTAVLSLALLTGPVLRFLTRYLTSLHTMLLFVTVLVLAGDWLARGSAVTVIEHPPAAVQILIVCTVLSFLLRAFIPRSVRFSRLPYWFTSFTAAQLAIQLGLGPLNAFYFQKYSLAAPLANFLAIPLIGVNVQLGIIAGILGFIPSIGDWLALVVNAGNYLTVKLFLGSASFFANSIPYPDVTPPPRWFMALYYLFLLFLAYQNFFEDKYRHLKVQLYPLLQQPAFRRKMAIAAVSLLFFMGSGFWDMQQRAVRALKITVFDMRVFNMGGGSSQLIEFPGGGTMLVDGGVARVMMRKKALDWNMGKMILAPVLRNKRIHGIDYLALSAPVAECAGGLPAIIKSFPVSSFIGTLPHLSHQPLKAIDMETYLQQVDDNYYREHQDKSFVQENYSDYAALIKALIGRSIPTKAVQRGDIIIKSTRYGELLKVEALHPPKNKLKGFRTATNNSLVLKVTYGNFACLLPGLITIDGEKSLLELGDSLKADVLIMPFHGHKGSFHRKFIEQVQPKAVIIQAAGTRWQKKAIQKTVRLLEKMNIPTYRTDYTGAVIVSSKGKGDPLIRTMFQIQAEKHTEPNTRQTKSTHTDKT